MDLRSFFGFLPPRLPHATAVDDLGPAPAPATVVLVLADGGPDDVAVAPGAQVRTGQDLARPGRGPLIATATGRVADVACRHEAGGGDAVAVTISVTGPDDFAADLQPIADPAAAEPAQLREALLSAGLPDLEALRDGVRIETLIASALDQEPGCAINPALLRAGAADLVNALRLWGRASGAGRLVLAVGPGQEPPADLPADVTVARTPATYPHGLPEMLALRQGGWLYRRTPAGPQGGTMVVGLDVLLAGWACLRDGRPFYQRTISCLGPRDRRPRNLQVRIGTPAAAVLEHLGLSPQPGGKLLLAGPMRGTACPDPARPVLAGTRQLVLQEPDQVHRFLPLPCTVCGLCDEICPVDLEVNLLGRFAEYDRFDRCADLAVERCIDCGLCSYVCPAHRPLAQLMMHAKQTLWRSPERRQDPAEAAGCKACGHSCPAIRLFDFGADPAADGQEKKS